MRADAFIAATEYHKNDSNAIAFLIRRPLKLPSMNSLGDRVRWAREQAGFSQPELAKKVGMAQSRLSKLETDTAPKGTSFLVKIAIACRVSAYWLETGRGPRKMGELEHLILGLSDIEQREWLAMIRARQAARVA